MKELKKERTTIFLDLIMIEIMKKLYVCLYCEQNSITLPSNYSSCSWPYQYASRECSLLNYSFIYAGKTCQHDY
jgi:hypothetical protein